MPIERCAIAVMAKAPRAGKVKTRLTPPLNPDEAASLSGCFLCDVTANIAQAARAAPIDGFIAYAPAGDQGVFGPMVEPGTGFVLADGAPEMPPGVIGFGRCLLHAAQGLFERGYRAVCLLNSDSPTLPTARLVEAADALLRSQSGAVLGPADDGGYYLIGMTAPHDHLFRNIDWSTERVADQTRARAAEQDLVMGTLAPWYDVDDMAALRSLTEELDGTSRAWTGGFAAPMTARWLARDGLRGRLATAA